MKTIRYYFAPMEGVTGHLFRGAHQRWFPGADKYYMPFFSPGREHVLPKRALRDFLPERNIGVNAVPQLLTRQSEDFIWAAGALFDMGYREVNLNLGCPSGTVTAKGKGAGFLAQTEALDQFLDEVFSAGLGIAVSVKTRLGMVSPDEFPALMEIYNRYPIGELTIHPRVRADFYREGTLRQDVFGAALAESRNPLCYNGDVATAADGAEVLARFPTVSAVMIGRGLIANPALLSQLRGGPGADSAALHGFLDEVYEGYCGAFESRRNAMMRMKEIWYYLIWLFGDREKYAKALKKTTDHREYESLVGGIFHNLPLLADAERGYAGP